MQLRLTRGLRAALRVQRLASSYLHALAAWTRRHRRFVTAEHAGAGSLDGCVKVAVFVHFDPRGVVHDYVVAYLLALRGAGFQVVFVSNAERLSRLALDRLTPHCAAILSRRNVGYDFAAYRDALDWLGDLSRFQTVILANDSVYGPLFDLAAVLARCDGSAQVWGMTDSWSRRYHLQSYFLLLQGEALRSPGLRRFWRGVLPVQSKLWIVRRYEVGFTQAALRAGLACAALFPYRAAAASLIEAAQAGELSDPNLPVRVREFLAAVRARVEAGVPLNAMHHFWDHLIARMGCPFLKRELLTVNPGRVPHIHVWERLIRDVSDYDTTLILRHLQAIARDRSP